MSLEGKIKILLIDDNESFTNAMNIIVLRKFADYIQNENLEIDCLNSGQSALEHLEKNNEYDLIIIDQEMPYLKGTDVIKIAKQKKNIKTPFIILSSNKDDKHHLEARLAGADAFIEKQCIIRSSESKQIFLLNLKLIIEAYRNKKILEKFATTDPLTKIANRRKFNQVLEEELKILNRAESSLALAYIDINNFKEVNDKMGHHRGDRYLNIIAKRLSITLKREADLVARIGGDEFGLIITNPSKTYLKNTLTQIHKYLHIPYKLSGLMLENPGASIGVVHYFAKDNQQTSENLINLADSLMFKNKNSPKSKRKKYELQILKAE